MRNVRCNRFYSFALVNIVYYILLHLHEFPFSAAVDPVLYQFRASN